MRHKLNNLLNLSSSVAEHWTENPGVGGSKPFLSAVKTE